MKATEPKRSIITESMNKLSLMAEDKTASEEVRKFSSDALQKIRNGLSVIQNDKSSASEIKSAKLQVVNNVKHATKIEKLHNSQKATAEIQKGVATTQAGIQQLRAATAGQTAPSRSRSSSLTPIRSSPTKTQDQPPIRRSASLPAISKSASYQRNDTKARESASRTLTRTAERLQKAANAIERTSQQTPSIAPSQPATPTKTWFQKTWTKVKETLGFSKPKESIQTPTEAQKPSVELVQRTPLVQAAPPFPSMAKSLETQTSRSMSTSFTPTAASKASGQQQGNGRGV